MSTLSPSASLRHKSRASSHPRVKKEAGTSIHKAICVLDSDDSHECHDSHGRESGPVDHKGKAVAGPSDLSKKRKQEEAPEVPSLLPFEVKAPEQPSPICCVCTYVTPDTMPALIMDKFVGPVYPGMPQPIPERFKKHQCMLSEFVCVKCYENIANSRADGRYKCPLCNKFGMFEAGPDRQLLHALELLPYPCPKHDCDHYFLLGDMETHLEEFHSPPCRRSWIFKGERLGCTHSCLPHDCEFEPAKNPDGNPAKESVLKIMFSMFDCETSDPDMFDFFADNLRHDLLLR
eukprot:jgi/Mesvir1/1472/Mv14456-RA.1